MEKTVLMSKTMILTFLMLLNFACGASKPMVMKEPQQIKPISPFEIVLLSDHKDNTYQVGEDIYFFFAANRDCYLTLLNVASDGRVKVLLPNQYQKDSQANAGFVYRLPSQNAKIRFKANEPAGENIVLAIATIENITLQEADIEEISTKAKPVDSAKWAQYKLAIKIVKKP